MFYRRKKYIMNVCHQRRESFLLSLSFTWETQATAVISLFEPVFKCCVYFTCLLQLASILVVLDFMAFITLLMRGLLIFNINISTMLEDSQ